MEKLTPSEAVHEYCRQCVCGSKYFVPKEVEDCKGIDGFLGPCMLYEYRMGKRISVKSIRKHCVDCHGGENTGECEIYSCPLFAYRQGKNPNRSGMGNGSSLVSFRKAVESGLTTVESKKGDRHDSE